MRAQRAILHVDMDAFFASVEQHDRPELRGKPVVVGGSGPRGVVAAASYECRPAGVRSAMPMRDALRRCPDIICVPPRMDRYREVSRVVFAIFREFTPLVEGLSLDEAFLDVTDSGRLLGQARRIGREIKRRIFAATGLTASVGAGPNKLVAKIASELNKPDGLRVVDPEGVNEALDPLPVSAISGIGPRTAASLEGIGITTVAQLRHAAPARLRPIFGRYVSRVQQRANGIDERPVEPHGEAKSISAEVTFDTDIGDSAALTTRLAGLADRTAARLRKQGLVAARVGVKIREADFTTHTRQRELHPPGDQSRAISRLARALLEEWLGQHPDASLRLLGVGVSELRPARQLELFGGGEAGRQEIDVAVDRIRERFGEHSLRRGSSLKA